MIRFGPERLKRIGAAVRRGKVECNLHFRPAVAAEGLDVNSALLGALSAKVPTLKVVDALGVEAPKTKVISSMCGALGAGKRVLVVAPVVGSALVKSAANIPGLEVLRADSLNVVDLVNADTIIMEQAALATIQEVYG